MLDLDKSFDDFIDGEVYDTAQNAMLDLVKSAFLSGWLLAGGDKPKDSKSLKLVTTTQILKK